MHFWLLLEIYTKVYVIIAFTLQFVSQPSTCSGSECAGNVPKLRRNASAAADISTMAEKCAPINPGS